MKPTKRPTIEETKVTWYLADATGVPLGRLASRVAQVLMGKNLASFDPSVHHNAKVVVINASHIKLTGNKLSQKTYYHHSGYPGGLKQTTLEELIAKKPAEALRRAVDGMLPTNKLRAARIDNLKVYLDDQHKHEAQTLTKLTF